MTRTKSRRNRTVSVSLKPLFRCALAMASLAAVAMMPAVAEANFSGPYAPANWTFQNTVGSIEASVDTSQALPAIPLISSDSSSRRHRVPDTGGTLSLLALGAFGIIMFRRRAHASA